MRLSRIKIKNFRNFKSLNVGLGEHAVILGENKVGKTNLLFALRLILDPSLPDSARQLRLSDFWDGLDRHLSADDMIEISLDFRGFEDNKTLLAILADSLVKPEPMVARVTYRFQPVADLDTDPRSEADYEFIVFGGNRTENLIGYELRRWMPMDLFSALRDAEGDLARWTRSPFRPLLDRAAADVDDGDLEEIAQEVQETTQKIAEFPALARVVEDVNLQLTDMVGDKHAVETALGFAPTDPEKLLRALQLMVDGGKRGVGEASLGSANVLYLALKQLENQHLVDEGVRQHTFLAIEEPEAHLHPHLQRRIYRNYLKVRGEAGVDAAPRNIILTTHSPNIASVAPLKNIVVLRLRSDPKGTDTVGRSLHRIDLNPKEIEDLERYIDVTRGELFFSKGVVLVEGDSERFLLPTLAKLHDADFDFDEFGISVCSISGTNFGPYIQLLGDKGLQCPFVVLTDFDPLDEDISQEDVDADEEVDQGSYGETRVVNLLRDCILSEDDREDTTFDDLLKSAPKHGFFLNEFTFEIDLFKNGAHEAFSEAMKNLTTNRKIHKRFKKLALDPGSLDPEQLLKDINSIGKGRFAQGLAAILLKKKLDVCPSYIAKALAYLKKKLT